MATPRLVELIDRYKNAHGVSEAELARRIGISRENLRKWRTNGVSRLPDRANLAAVARVIGRPYREVLSAALFDTDYLTDAQAAIPRPYDEVLHDAVSVLTEASRLTNKTMRQTSSGQWEVDPDPRAAVPIDWAEFVTLALAGAAANVGGVEAALAGRGGSWEAEMVRQTLNSTVFDDKDLLRHRTEPVVVDLWVESILSHLGDPSDDLYAAAANEVDARADTVPHPTDLPPGPFSPDDPRLIDKPWVEVTDDGYLHVTYLNWTDDPDDLALLTTLTEQARSYRDPTLGEIAYEQALEAISAQVDAVDALQRREYSDYAAQLTKAIEDNIAKFELTVPVTVSVTLAPQDREPGAFDAHAPQPLPRNAIEGAIDSAITETPTPSMLPGTPLDRVLSNRPETARRGEESGGEGE
jgi:transcriptional regulator with XRE-family HTH domain